MDQPLPKQIGVKLTPHQVMLISQLSKVTPIRHSKGRRNGIVLDSDANFPKVSFTNL